MMPARPTPSKMPVLFVNTPTLPPIGADTWIHAEIIRALDRSRFEVHVACATGPADAPTPFYSAISNIPDTHLRPVDFGRESADLPPLRRVVQTLVDLRAIASLAGLAVYVRRQRIPIIHTVSRPRDAFACVVLAKLTRTKCLIHMQLAYGEWMSRPLRWALRHADGLVAISEFVERTLVQSGHRADRIHLAYNAVVLEDWDVAEDRSDARSELDLPASAPIVLTVSRLFPAKGTTQLVRAIAIVRDQLPDVKLVVVGRDTWGGSYMAELQDIVRQEHLEENVVFAGQRSDVPRFMAAADIFAMPSFDEPFGIVFAEAMATGVPVVALNNGGTPEVVHNGKAGLLSESHDITTLAENLLTLLGDPELRRRMGTYGREQVEKRFTMEHLANEMAEIYVAVAR